MRTNRTRARRRSRAEGANWLSFSDLMSSLVLIFILIMFYIMYQYFDMYEINMAEIARQQFDLDQANADLEEKTSKLSEAEQQMIAQQIRLDAAQKDLDDAESVLASQQAELATAQSLLSEKEAEITAQKDALDALGLQLDEQQAQITLQQQTLDAQRLTMDQQQQTMDAQQTRLDEQQQTMNAQQLKLNEQQQTMDAQQIRLNEQQTTMDQQRIKLDEQQQTLEDQQLQIEQLVGLKTRIITSLSAALKQANISAQVDLNTGAIALESDVLFATNKYDLSERGKAFIDRFLPVYLDVLFSEDYQPYVAEVIIEGHTDTAGDYITNLQLSQRRALAVASYVLSDNYPILSHAENHLLRKLVTANGRSFSDPVLDAAGNVDMDASRRVVFKFRLADEQMIQQLKSILESSDGQ